jgi:hypothetical protein
MPPSLSRQRIAVIEGMPGSQYTLAIPCQSPGGSVDSTSHTVEWTPYETRAASITYERKTEVLQLEQLRIRLHKKMREAEDTVRTGGRVSPSHS